MPSIFEVPQEHRLGNIAFQVGPNIFCLQFALKPITEHFPLIPLIGVIDISLSNHCA